MGAISDEASFYFLSPMVERLCISVYKVHTDNDTDWWHMAILPAYQEIREQLGIGQRLQVGVFSGQLE